jgi:hypothetical protein
MFFPLECYGRLCSGWVFLCYYDNTSTVIKVAIDVLWDAFARQFRSGIMYLCSAIEVVFEKIVEEFNHCSQLLSTLQS